MTSYYEVLRPVVPADLDAQPRSVEVLEEIPSDGYVTFERFRHLGKNRANNGLAHACSLGIIKRVSPHERVLKLDSVKFWCAYLSEPGFRHTANRNRTMYLYLGVLAKFDEWLQDRQFSSHETVRLEGQPARGGTAKSFANVEMLKEYCHMFEHGERTAQYIVRKYLASQQADGVSDSVRTITRTVIKVTDRAHEVK